MLAAIASGTFLPAAETPVVGALYPELRHFFQKLDTGQPVKVVYFGGSITFGAFDTFEDEKNETHSFRALVTQYFKTRGVAGAVTSIDASIGSTGSDLGVFRMDRDVVPYVPDLTFIEFAVNGGGREAIEGIIRKLHRADPAGAIVILIVGTGHNGTINLPGELKEQVRLAKHYGIPLVDVATTTRRMIIDEQIKFTDIFVGQDQTHPKESGHRIYADIIIRNLEQASAEDGVARAFPPPLTKNRFENARMIELGKLSNLGDWEKTAPNAHGRWRDQEPARWFDSAVKPSRAGAVLPIGDVTCSGVGLYYEASAGGGAMALREGQVARLNIDSEFSAADQGRAVTRYGFTFVGASQARNLSLFAPNPASTVAAYLLYIP